MENMILDKLNSILDTQVLTDFGHAGKVFFTIIGVLAILYVLAYIVKWIIFKIYCNCSNKNIQDAVDDIIYQIDEIADTLSNKEKKKEAVNAVKDIFIWRAVPIPSFIIGIIIDLEVKAIRKLQKNAAKIKNPYLHPDEETDNGFAEKK